MPAGKVILINKTFKWQSLSSFRTTTKNTLEFLAIPKKEGKKKKAWVIDFL